MTEHLPEGLYELLVTERLLAGLDEATADLAPFTGKQPELLLDTLGRVLSDVLQEDGESAVDIAQFQVDFINSLLVSIRERLRAQRPGWGEPIDVIASPPHVLRSIKQDRQFPQSPELGLAVPWIFTAGKGSPSLLQEIRRELASADAYSGDRDRQFRPQRDR